MHFVCVEGGDGLREALEGNMSDLGAGGIFQPLDEKVRIAAQAHRRKIEFVRILLRIFDKLRIGVDRHVPVEDDNLLAKESVCDRLEISDRIIGELPVELRIDGHSAPRQDADGIAVRRRRLACVCRQDGVRAGPVFHDHASAGSGLELLTERPGEDIDGAARLQGNDDLEGPRRVFLLCDSQTPSASDAQKPQQRI